MWPEVEFQLGNGQKSRVIIRPVLFDSNTRDGELLGQRWQLPIIPAVCLTVHKAQGLTLPAVVIDFGEFWEHGQGNSAVSRVELLENVYIIGSVSHSAFVCDHRVKHFLRQCSWAFVETGERARA
jgi:hypothetical protein